MHTLLAILVLALAPPDRPNPTPKQQGRPIAEDILGEWQVIYHFTGGKDDNRNTLMWVFSKESMQHVYNENGTKRPASTFPYTLDVGKSPAVIVFPASKFAGILKVEGDVLMICLHGSPELQPPPDFASPENTRTTLLKLTRVRK
jgi:hypothetical protein